MTGSFVRDLLGASVTFVRLAVESRLPQALRPLAVVQALISSFTGKHPEPGGPHHGLQPVRGPKKKVVVLGGGAAGVSAAFWLTHPDFGDRYDVTLYQTGWRLGGKCASGRNMEHHKRIEEHGLHLLMGCYQHAFHAIRACYEEWTPWAESRFRSIEDAFERQSRITLMEADPLADSAWHPWQFQFAEQDGVWPGKAESGETWPVIPQLCDLGALFSSLVERYMRSYFSGTRMQWRSSRRVAADIDAAFDSARAAFAGRGERNFQLGYRRIRRLHSSSKGHFGELALEGMAVEERQAESHARVLIDLGLAVIEGALRDVCGPGMGVDALNEKEFRAWLGEHGASRESLDSAPIRALYDLMFAYRDGDASGARHTRLEKADVAAGVALQFVFEVVAGYDGAVLWKMKAGMGDTIFTPFYQVLRKRGVDIKLFHRVRALELTSDRSRLGRILIDRQARANGEYWPFERVQGLDCWPSDPRWSELEDGAALSRRRVNFESSNDTTRVDTLDLEIGPDDIVIVALPPEVLKQVTADLQASSPKWKKLLESAKSVQTLALQLWARRSVTAMGGEPGAIVSAFEPPFASCADMTHLLDSEHWDAAARPQAVAYLCGCIPTRTAHAEDDNREREERGARNAAGDDHGAGDWIDIHLPQIWPGAGAANRQPTVTNPFIDRYDRLNADASDLYVQTPAGTVAQRPSPNEPCCFPNLYVAGDWTKTRFSGGCVESAFESGLRVAGAVDAALRRVSVARSTGGR